ncbi:MAG: hypothetical protein K6A44_04525 [bacterium]|nr:hypothetical protein [bacterium]
MTKKEEAEAKTSLEKLDELTKDILNNGTMGGDPNFRQIVFSGLTQTKNKILLEKMEEILFVPEEEDLKKTIILGIFLHKEMFSPVIKYGESVIDMPYIDDSYDEKESFLFVLDGLVELAYKNKLDEFESAIPLLMQLYKIACSEKSTSVMADKLLQRFLNSKIGTVKELQQEFSEVIKDETSEINEVVIAIDILSRGQYAGVLELIEEVLMKLKNETTNLAELLPLLDISTLAISYFSDAKYHKKVKKLLGLIKEVKLSSIEGMTEIIERIKRRVKKLHENINSKN